MTASKKDIKSGFKQPKSTSSKSKTKNSNFFKSPSIAQNDSSAKRDIEIMT